MYVNLLIKVDEPDGEVYKKTRVTALMINNDNLVEQVNEVEGNKLMTVSLMKDVFMVLSDRSRMNVGVHTVIDVGLHDTCNMVDIEVLPDDYRELVKNILQLRNDASPRVLRTGLQVPEGYKDVVYINYVEE